MTTVICASQNPVKLEAARRAFGRMLPEAEARVQGIAVESTVSAQPRTSEETLRGAEARASRAREIRPEADFWLGIEGGIDEEHAAMEAFAWVVVLSPRGWGRSRSGSFLLPPPVAELVRSGMELGEADDRVFGRRDSKRKEGAIGLLTDGVVDRTDLYEHAVVLSLVPFRRDELYRQALPPSPKR